jgi:1-phosphofructokinase family hexose kinase
MILTVTPNPMLDKTLWVPAFAPGNIHRALRLDVLAGGKGINVTRALHFLKENAVATGFVGGRTGEEIVETLKQEGLQHDFVTVAGTTREGFTIVDSQTGQHTAVFEPGHQLTGQEIEALFKKVADLLPYCQALALCGSMPCPGFDGFYARLIEQARRHNVPVMLDTYGEPLQLGLKASPNFLKPNRDEALQTFGIDGREPGGKRKLLEKFAGTGATHVFLTDGERPVAVFAEGEFFLAQPPNIRAVNALGSGDAMVAAFLYGYLRSLSTPLLIAFAIAGGAVNAREFLPGFADLDQITTLATQIEIEPLES